MEIKSVAILGAGAVGSYLIWGLSEKPEIDLCVVADGQRKQRMEQDGFLINDRVYRPAVKTPAEAHGADLLIVALKYNALRPALEDIAAVTDEHTVIMSLMNGVDSEDIIAERVGMEHVLHAMIKIASERKGNAVRFAPETTIGMVYGEADLSRGSQRVEALNRLFTGTPLHFRATDKIRLEIWNKYRLNISINQVQAILGCGAGIYRDSEHAIFLRDQLKKEAEAVALAYGVDLSVLEGQSAKGCPVKDTARYSTLQDLDAGRATEVDMLAGALVRMGREKGVPTPFNEFAYHMIKCLEEKNRGMFNY